MRSSVAIVLAATVAQTIFWSIFSGFVVDPDYWKVTGFGLLLGVLLTLPILRNHYSNLATATYAFRANLLAGLIASLIVLAKHSGIKELGATILTIVALSAWMVWPHLGRFAATIFGDDSAIANRLIRMSTKSKREPAKLGSDIISVNYYSSIRKASLVAVIGLLVLSWIALYLSEISTAVLLIFLCFGIIGHVLSTEHRVRNGSFGSNASEAEELISYIISHFKKTGGPPGRRLQAPGTHELISDPSAGATVRGEA